MNKLYWGGEQNIKINIYDVGTIVRFKQPGTNIIGVVVSKSYRLPSNENPEGHFNIKTLIVYKYNRAHSESFKTVGGIGGNFTHRDKNNLVKLTKKQIKRLGTQLLLALYE